MEFYHKNKYKNNKKIIPDVVSDNFLLDGREGDGLSVVIHFHAVGNVRGREDDSLVAESAPLPVRLIADLPIFILNIKM